MCIGIITSCKKDNDVNSGQIQLLSFGPTGAMHGDTLRFIGNNLSQVTEIIFTGNAVIPQSDFLDQNSEVIMVIVPQAAEQGFVTLKTPQGDIVSKTKLNLEVVSTITSITTQARPGENITITGNYLNWVTRVTFADGKNVDSFVTKTMNQVVVTVPMDAQTGPLVISYGGTEPMDIQTNDTLKVTLPNITGISPTPIKHASNLTITGNNLDLVEQVLFNGDTTHIRTFISQSVTKIVVKVPGGTKQGKVTLFAFSGVSVQSSMDLEVILPAITLLSPNPIDSLTNLTITGSNLDLVKGISFVGVANPVTTFVSQSATQIVVKLPSGVFNGKLTFAVSNSTLKVESAQELKIKGSAVTPVIVYDEALNTSWEKFGGWGTSEQEMASTEHSKSGSKSIKVTWTDAYGAIQLHPKTSFPLPNGFTSLKLSVYGGSNATATSRIAVYIKQTNGGDPTDAQKKILTLIPGTYSSFTIPLSDFGNNPVDVNELVIQNYGTVDISIYVDDIGFY